jgi:hypothetical protein
MAAAHGSASTSTGLTDATGGYCFEFAQLITPRHDVRCRVFDATSFTPR